MSDPAFLRLESLTRIFAGTPVVHDLTLEIHEHEIVTLLGPSGCGKTTTLRMVAGFERPDSGRVLLSGAEITNVAPQRRDFGMVFQHYALFPHLDVGANVAFGLDGTGLTTSEVSERLHRALNLVRLPGIERRSVGSLSGGQQQRVALARALAPEPQVLLLDEPLSNLDASLRERTRRELRALVKEIGITSIYVTHDQEEAFELSDRIAVMREGRLDQVGPAEALYHRPATEFVAKFLGRAGSIEGVAVSSPSDDVVSCRIGTGTTWNAFAPADGQKLVSGTAVKMLVRPEALQFTQPDADGALAGTVSERRFAGSVYVYKLTVKGGELEVQTARDVARQDETVGLRPISPPTGMFVFPRKAELESE